MNTYEVYLSHGAAVDHNDTPKQIIATQVVSVEGRLEFIADGKTVASFNHWLYWKLVEQDPTPVNRSAVK